MDIVIVGGGKVGEKLARDLSYEGHNIVLIEKNMERFDEIVGSVDITGVIGNGASYETQVEAGVDKADIFIAVSEYDEINIISCILAKKLGAKYTIARVRAPEYNTNPSLIHNELGISMMINPEHESAKKIMESIRFPSANSVESFLNGKVNIVEFLIKKNNPIIGKALKDINLSDEKILFCIVERNGETFIPDGNFVIEEADHVYITGSTKAITEVVQNLNLNGGRIKTIFIVGGGNLAYYLAKELLYRNFKVKIIEIDEKRAEFLSQEFPEAIIINEDGTDQNVLREERIDTYDVVVSCTGIDEENMIVSMFAESVGVPKNIAKVSREAFKPILERLNLDTVISPKMVIADTIIKFIRNACQTRSSKVENLHRLVDGKVEALQFSIKDESDAVGIPLKNLNFIENVLIVCIKRNDTIIYPGGNDFIMKNDHVLLVTKEKHIEEFDDILVK